MDEPKMVPETDLIALKESHGKTIEELKAGHVTELATAGTESGDKLKTSESKAKTSEEEATRLRATVSQLEESGKTHASTVEERDGLKVEAETNKKALKEATDGLKQNYMDQLTAGYGIPDSALKDKSVTELKSTLEILKVSRSPNSRDFTTGGGSGGEPPKTGREKISAGLEGGDLHRQ